VKFKKKTKHFLITKTRDVPAKKVVA